MQGNTLFTCWTEYQLSLACVQGLIQPLIPGGSEAAVFAVYNDRKQLQYVGFSKDLYNSLRTLLGRRPDKAFYYKYAYLWNLARHTLPT